MQFDDVLEKQFQGVFGDDQGKTTQPEERTKALLEQRGNEQSRPRKNVERISTSALAKVRKQIK